MPTATVTETETLLSGLETDAVIDSPYGENGFRVTWIAWDSSFRKTPLAIGDLITKVDGKTLEDVLQPGKFGNALGQANESMQWEASHAKPNQPLRLTVRRREQTLEVTGSLQPERFYNGEGGRLMSPNGPPRMTRDDFDSAWCMWVEDLIKKMSGILDGFWESSQDSQRELTALLEEQPRIEFLKKTYAGPFADTLAKDWEATVECLRGKKLDSVDLQYRSLGADFLASVKATAEKSWATFKESLAKQMIPAFPAPSLDQRGAATGKVVELPNITQNQWVSDLGRSFAAAVQSDGAYFVPLNGQGPYGRVYEAMSRFKGQASPTLSETTTFIGAIQPNPIMVTVNGRPVTGYVLDLLGVRVGNDGECVIDLRTTTPDGKSLYAGETTQPLLKVPEIKDDATPAQVIEAMIIALKLGDQPSWQNLFATWTASKDEQVTVFKADDPPTTRMFDEAWETSRKHIMGDVVDAQVSRSAPIRKLMEADAKAGLPNVDKIVIWVDHFGQFGNEIRAFNHFTLHRRWQLQRVNNGPWRIADVQSL